MTVFLPETKRRQREIERISRSLVHAAGIQSPPVDLEVVAQHLGVSIQRADLGHDCAGVLVRGATSAVIGVHWADPPKRQRFTIAHELGHYRLHEGGQYIDKDITVRYRGKNPGSGTIVEEREANYFAGALLMPRGWLKTAMEEEPFRYGDDLALAALADRFKVSMQALSIRLAELRLLLRA